MQAFKEQGNTCFAEGKYAEVMALYTKAIESAACSIELHLYDEAEVDANKVILLDQTFTNDKEKTAAAKGGYHSPA